MLKNSDSFGSELKETNHGKKWFENTYLQENGNDSSESTLVPMIEYTETFLVAIDTIVNSEDLSKEETSLLLRCLARSGNRSAVLVRTVLEEGFRKFQQVLTEYSQTR